MNMLTNLSQFFGLNDEEEFELETAADNQESRPSKAEKSETKRELKKQRAFNTRREPATTNKVVSLKNPEIPYQSKIVVFEPRVYSEVQEIADLLLSNQSVVLNFTRIEEDQAKRIVDFLTGTIYAISGDIQRIGEEIFLCTPKNVEINGALSDAMQENDFY
ncbi:cell division protein SepF [Carnobacterium viridans]|uniref:Cell division protein SepF n=1 Tax=Carnobacterium viridans TaxID=174587 RepID=A0A1H1BL76_9LACT|nr:cell division protein SepF [Carnobacterium viridans]UDE95747.1 cell division protein SepF [Carnobacterium viridans]SDQ52490.1 cell division inhibitor SepF [Carnobacterium viridans]